MGKKKKVRKQKELERLAPVLAGEVGLVCKQYRQVRPGKFERCPNAASCYIIGAGDACDDHKGSAGALRYATARKERRRAA